MTAPAAEGRTTVVVREGAELRVLAPGTPLALGGEGCAAIPVRDEVARGRRLRLEPAPGGAYRMSADGPWPVSGGAARRETTLGVGDAVRVGAATLTVEPLDPPGALGRLHRITRGIWEEARLEPLLAEIVDAAVGLVGAERGFLLLRAGEALDVAVARDARGEALAAPQAEFSRTMAREVTETGSALLTRDAGSLDGTTADAESVKLLGLRSIACVPLRVGSEILGAIYVDHRQVPEAFDRGSLGLLQVLAEHAATAIRRARDLARVLEDRQDEVRRARSAVAELSRRLRERPGLGRLVGHSPEMRRLYETVERAAPSPFPVLVTGESGTGKELVARALHERGPRRDGPFIPVNCASVASQLLEGELFGHAAGAFTGATEDRPGLIEVAHGGTLFLDEVGDMDPRMQADLLRVLQDGEVRRVGAREARRVDVRFIAATHRDLAARVEAGAFREDLLFRLRVIELSVPPLRCRKGDLPELVHHLLAGIAAELGTAPKAVAPEALDLLVAHDWPGNVRELENELRRLMVLAGEGIRPGDLSPRVREPTSTPGAARGGALGTLRDAERGAIAATLEGTRWNQSEAARRLGISRRALYNKIRALGLRPGSER